jgi:hypothetical protein
VTEPDRALFDRVLEQEGLHSDGTEPTRLAWAWDRLATFLRGLFDAVTDAPGMGELVWMIAAVLAALLVVLALVTVVRILRLWRVGGATSAGVEALPVMDPGSTPDPARFRAEAESALLAGRPRDAARATWAWVAWTLHARAVAAYEPDLTNGEFVARVRATTSDRVQLDRLGAFARATDRLCYGAAEPAPDEAHALLGDAAAVVSEAGSPA